MPHDTDASLLCPPSDRPGLPAAAGAPAPDRGNCEIRFRYGWEVKSEILIKYYRQQFGDFQAESEIFDS